MNYTGEQKLCIEEAVRGSSLLIKACPGSGKTATLEGIARELTKAGKRGHLVCYNKSTSQELIHRFSNVGNLSITTIHSMAYRILASNGLLDTGRVGNLSTHAISKVLGSMKIDVMPEFVELGKDFSGSVRLTELLELSGPRLYSLIGSTLSNFWNSEDIELSVKHSLKPAEAIIGYFRQTAKYIVDNLRNKEDIISEIAAESLSEVLYRTNKEIVSTLAQTLYNLSKDILMEIEEKDGRLPIPHDHYLKKFGILLGAKELKFPKMDFFMVDEWQDSNGATLLICEHLKKNGVQIITAGDPLQQINSWRGSINAFDRSHFGTIKELTQCFRFGEEIATFANNFVREYLDPDYEMKGNLEIASVLDKVPRPNAVLCRSNGKVIGEALNIIQNGGTPYAPKAMELISLIKGMEDLKNGKTTTHPDLCLFGSFEEYTNYAESGEDPQLKLLVHMFNRYGESRLKDLIKTISVKTERTDTHVLTIHSAKGLEWNTIRVADDIYVPLKEADTPNKMEIYDAERKLYFVAITRGKYALDVYSADKTLQKFMPPHKNGKRALEAIQQNNERKSKKPAFVYNIDINM